MNKQLVLILFCLAGSLEAMEQETALHQAARAKDYDACVKELVHIADLHGQALETALFPKASLRTFQDPASSADEKGKAQRALGACVRNFHMLLVNQLVVAQQKKQTMNGQRKIAHDIAQEVQAPDAIIGLLNPNNTMIMKNLLMAYLMETLQIPEGTVVALVPDRNPGQPLFNVGDKITIQGKTRTVNAIYRAPEEK